MDFPKAEPVLVEWLDTQMQPGWGSLEEHENRVPVFVTSVGHLLKRHKDRIVISLSVRDGKGAADSLTIPIGCVKKVRRLHA